jgi:hypothetical protein
MNFTPEKEIDLTEMRSVVNSGHHKYDAATFSFSSGKNSLMQVAGAR